MQEKAKDQKFIEMTQTPVEKLIVKLAIPSIISMMVTTIYNMADTFFIGMISTSASGAVGIAFSMMSIIQALGFFFGQGAGSGISRALGKQDSRNAEELASVGFFSAIFCGIVVTVLGTVFIKPLVYFLGATDTIYPYAVSYLQIIFIGAPWVIASYVLNNLLRFEGNAMQGMIGLTIGGVLNMVLDPVLIFVFDMGIAGAAWATIISQAISFAILLYLSNHKTEIKIRFSCFKPSFAHYVTIFRGGLPSLLRQCISSVSTICLNTMANPYGDAAISAMSIVGRVGFFANSAMLGFGQGFQPVCGYNYGARLYDRVRKGYFFCVKVAAAALLAISVLEYFFAEPIIQLFRDDPEVIAIGSTALRFHCMTLVCNAVIVPSNMTLQVTGKVVPASLVGISRQGLFLIPALLILTNLFGLTGIQLAQPVADVASLLLTVPLIAHFLRNMGLTRSGDPADD